MFGVSIAMTVGAASRSGSRVSTTRPTLGLNFGMQGGRVNVSDGYRIGVSILGGRIPVDSAMANGNEIRL